jgi:hypothetical protein
MSPEDDPSPPPPQINLDILDYPSDGLTVKQLRTLFPEQFREDGPSNFFSRENRSNSGLIEYIVVFERDLAKHAFDRVLGRSSEWMAPARPRDLRGHLADLYARFQIAQGPQEARQLIRDLEKAAAEQARQHIRGRRP